MKTRLMLEESCVHGYFQDCTFLLDSGEPCPGGTSREVTVDYLAAANRLVSMYPQQFERIELSSGDWVARNPEPLARQIVDAALEGT